MLTLPESTKGLVLYYDPSRVELGCVLMLNRKVIDYASRKLRCKREMVQPMILVSSRGLCLENVETLLDWCPFGCVHGAQEF